MVIYLLPRTMGDVPDNFNGQFQQVTQFGLPFDILHSTNVLLMPVNERQNFWLFPTVMPNVSGYCDWCARTFDQVALETLGDYLGATAYNRLSSMRSRPCSLSLKMQDCRDHREAMDPVCINEKINNTCNKLPNFKDSFISQVIYLFVNLLS